MVYQLLQLLISPGSSGLSPEVIQYQQGSVADLLKELALNPETYLVIRDGQLLTRDEVVGGDDMVEMLSSISGG